MGADVAQRVGDLARLGDDARCRPRPRAGGAGPADDRVVVGEHDGDLGRRGVGLGHRGEATPLSSGHGLHRTGDPAGLHPYESRRPLRVSTDRSAPGGQPLPEWAEPAASGLRCATASASTGQRASPTTWRPRLRAAAGRGCPAAGRRGRAGPPRRCARRALAGHDHVADALPGPSVAAARTAGRSCPASPSDAAMTAEITDRRSPAATMGP